MSDTVRFGVATVALVVAAGWLLGLAFPGGAQHRAIAVSGAVAVVVQVLSFLAVRRTMPTNVFAGWGAAAVARFVVLAVYALAVVRAFALPSSAALVSLATFFFVSTVVEPLMLNR